MKDSASISDTNLFTTRILSLGNYISGKIIWEHVQQQGVIADITEQANRFFDHGDTKKLLFHYFAITSQKVTDKEITAEIDNCEINYRVIDYYIPSMNKNDIPLPI